MKVTITQTPQPFDFQLFEGPPPPHRVLLLDYDGTLSPFRPRRDEAVPYPGIIEALNARARIDGTRIVIVSGRPIDELLSLLEAAGEIEIWGSHGWERRKPGGHVARWRPDPAGRLALVRAADIAVRLLPHESVEQKRASVAAHLRGVEPERARTVLDQLHSAWGKITSETDLRLLTFNGGLEIYDSSHTKGTVLEAVRKESKPDTFFAYLGDDQSDEEAFARMGPSDWSILVADQLRQSFARFQLRPPEEVIHFLECWHDWICPP